ncbi:MAG: DUF2238 domain-containing protein [bacterium]|nr:DUF2238 domain-containing protein [bacterium]
MTKRNECIDYLSRKGEDKEISKIIAVIFIIAGFILFFGKRGWFPDFYNPEFMGVVAFISAFLIISPRLIFKAADSGQQKILNLLQGSIVAGLSLNGLGALGLYRADFGYDKILHFFVPLLFTIVIANFCRQWYKLTFKKSIILSMIIIFLAGLFWEFFEFFCDNLFNTKMLGYCGEFIVEDTVLDLIAGFFGIIGGVLILFRKRILPN